MHLRRLHDLLESLFDEYELRQFITYYGGDSIPSFIPDQSVPRSQLVFLTVVALQRRGLIDRRFFTELKSLRPGRSADISRVMTTMGIDAHEYPHDPSLPDGWFIAGSAPTHYQARIISPEPKATYSALANVAGVQQGFGTLMQTFDALDYRGKRLRYQASLRTHQVTGWAGIWMRVDTSERTGVSFDNMKRRALRASTPWTLCKVVLAVPADAATISFGVLLNLEGQVDMRDQSLEETSEPVTSEPLSRAPRNLW